ncbi:MAG TPA: bifunctional riboflavin kinase/FAD synthetase [Bacteroidota bacterium]|nr:bifunctional riboflavin kinase/FAD synthetase [Bacteroidota bacterium]
MKVAHRLEEISFDKNSVVSVGSFDGVHRAHQALIQEVVRRARQRKGRSVIVTFDPHPKEVLSADPEKVVFLSTLDEKLSLCEELGVDVTFVLEFTYEFSRQSFRDFYLRYIVHGIGVSEVVEGYDHHFGRDREGSIEELLRLGREFEFSVVAMKPVHVGEEVVSSSRIRELLIIGDLERANELLGRPYTFGGIVVKGDGRGKLLGFPTANLQPKSTKKIIPKNGIYFVEASVGDASYFGLANVGVRPTFESNGPRIVEVYLLDTEIDLYGQYVEVRFLKRLRDEIKFNSAEELIEQMKKDREEGSRLRTELTKVYKLSSSR